MRQAINNLQSTWSGFGFVSPEGVFKVCDQPHPVVVNAIVTHCTKSEIDPALDKLGELWSQGYSAVDIVTTLFRVVKNSSDIQEYLKLEFIREIGFSHMRILEGVSTVTQLGALIARLCRIQMSPELFQLPA